MYCVFHTDTDVPAPTLGFHIYSALPPLMFTINAATSLGRDLRRHTR